MTSDFIIDVSEADFEYQVLAYSQQAPVVVDFWADWCQPCKILGPILEKLAQEAQGDFRLAKLNVDENPNLTLRYAVRSIPVVKAFRNGEIIAEFIGAQPETRIRDFLHSIAPGKSDLLLEKGLSLLKLQQNKEAESTLRQVLDDDPENTQALLGLTKSLLLDGRAQESYAILKNFPTSREYNTAMLLLPLAEALVEQTSNDPYLSEDPLEASFFNAKRLIKIGNLEAAMDGLLDILRKDKKFRNDEARQVMVGILELLGDSNPITKQYRRELASVLF
jgi:putative thioredoxin